MPQLTLESKFSKPGDFADCRAILETGSRSFFAASRLLPPAIREAATALYAFCRAADDAIDVNDGGTAAVAGLRQRLDKVYAGAPFEAPVDRALADVVHGYDIPRDPLDALIDGVGWDTSDRKYETISDLHDYAVRVAGSVGVLSSLLMGVRDPERLARACDLGVAMQLTNIARDVGEDARSGRLYLPREWLREEGIDPEEWLRNPTFNPQLAAVVQRLLDHAAHLYELSETGIAQLPLSCRPAIFAARFIYGSIGNQVARNRYDSISERAIVSVPRKVGLLAFSCLATVLFSRRFVASPLPEAQFLINAIEKSSRARTPLARAKARPKLIPDFEWVLELFVQLEQRERAAR